jgi:hypothetical protein
MVRPLLGCLQLLVVFDVARFRCRWILVFWDMYSLVRWELFHMCYSVSVGEFLLHVGYSVVLEPGRWILFHVRYSVSVGEFGCTWATPECSLGIMGYLLDSVELVIWAFFLLSWLCFFKAMYCTWLSIVYSHLFFSCCWFYLVFRYLRHAWVGVAHLLFTRHTTLFRWFTFIVTSCRFRELPI